MKRVLVYITDPAKTEPHLIDGYNCDINNAHGQYIHFTQSLEGAFRVVLPNIHVRELSSENEKYLPILRLFEKQNEITRSDVEEALGIGTTYAINMLKEMQEKELIIKVGNGKLTRYVAK